MIDWIVSFALRKRLVAVMICIFLSLFCLAYFRIIGRINPTDDRV